MRNPEKVSTKPKAEKITATKPASPAATPQVKAVESETMQHLTTENIRAFTDAYEEKKQLKTELKAMDIRAQKGKIPRGQYKANRKRVELRIEALSRTIEKFKDLFRTSGATYVDIARQIDSAEEDLAEAEENIHSLESKQKKSEISLENYKEEVSDYQKQKEKAESAINGILLRLREKTR
jgi:chromosome segregation ATPase